MERCPHCNSTSTKTLPMIYSSGSSTSSSMWVTSRGRVGSRSGSRQTRLAAAAAPPRAPSIVLGFIGMLIVSGIVWIVLANLIAPVARLIPNARQASLFQTLSPLFMLGVVVIIFFGWIIRHRAKKKRYIPRRATWEQTWMCQKCGTTWV
jgi:ABC-type xylose transport system permease subunit